MKKILIIDDDYGVSTVMQKLLDRFYRTHATVQVANTLEEAETLLSDAELAILDVEFCDQDAGPEGNSGKIALKLAEQGVPFVRFTGRPDPFSAIPDDYRDKLSGAGVFIKPDFEPIRNWLESSLLEKH